MDVFSGDGALCGRCRCGAVFVVDETGKAGGAALLDALALACDGDLDRAQRLESGEDYEVKTRPYRETRSRFSGRLQPGGYLPPKVWAIRLKARVDKPGCQGR